MAKASTTRKVKRAIKSSLPKGSSEELKLGVEKLLSSGLSLDDAETLGIEILSEFQTAQLHSSFSGTPALKLNYYNLIGEPLSPRPKWPAFYRIRYLKDVDDPNSFAGQTEKKPLRYVNEPEAGVAAYMPRSIDWMAVAADIDVPIIITEGELKAAKACKEGFETIGLGGVFNFKAVRQGIPFLPELEEFEWVKRNVYICYDSDYLTNPNVCLAMNQLAEELVERGAIVYALSLPDLLEDGKTGLDDLLVTAPDPVNMLRGLLRQAEPLGLGRPLWRLNEKVVYVRDPGLILVRKSHQKLSPEAFKSHAFSTISYTEQVIRSDGEMSYRKVSAAPAWMQWPLRAEVTQLLYEPGQDQLVEDPERGGLAFNVWKGWGCEPVKGDLKLWNQLLDHLFVGAEKEDRQWFERWLAYPLQHPGTKLYSAAVIFGIHHGTGKSLIGYMMGRIYGRNFVEINKDNLTAGNYDWAEARQFVLGDEVTGSSKRDVNDMLKKLITQATFRINIKYVPTFEIRDVINYLFTSNHPDAFFMEDNERRYFIHEVKVGPLGEDFYTAFDEWMKRGPGPSALFHHLLNLDLGDFNPHAPARKTQARSRMIADTKSDLGEWVARLLADPEAMLKVGKLKADRDMFTNRELLALYDPEQRTGTTANGLGRELRRSGVMLAYDGHTLPSSDGADRYYVLRNLDKWAKAKRQDFIIHLGATQKKRASSKKF
jgi:hypothetical protein